MKTLQNTRLDNELDAVWSLSCEEVLSLTGGSLLGLSREEAERRRHEYGPNAFAEERSRPAILRLLAQFNSPVIWTLLAATFLSALLGQWVDATAIVAIVLLNGVMGFLQESRAEAAALALKRMSAPKVRVLRDGHAAEIPTEEVTVGDLLILEAGDYIAADARIIESSQLSTIEATLTGESLPVSKHTAPLPAATALAEQSNMLLGGTWVNTGTARAFVTAIGEKSSIGKISELLAETVSPETPLQGRLRQLNVRLLVLALSLVTITAMLGLLHGEPWLAVVMSAIGLAVAAVPEGLPAVVTLALALSVRRMAKKNAIIRQLPAVETLGSVDVICTDKTGTLTTGKMEVREVLTSEGERILANDPTLLKHAKGVFLLRAAVLCSNADLLSDGNGSGDTTEVALLGLANSQGVDIRQWRDRSPRVAEWSFESTRKRMSVAVSEEGRTIIYVKGAPESLIPLCKDFLLSDSIRAEAEKLSREGRRLLALGYRTWDGPLPKNHTEVEAGLTFAGIVAISDPPRKESISAIAACKAAGISVVMITGDHPVTATAIAVELGIVDSFQLKQTIIGADLQKLSDIELEERVAEIAVYARVSPEDKLRIVRAWKRKGMIVAMTGDGVNDAPALKEASIGISMGKGGTEVARQASSLILADDHFETIVFAIREGRAIYGNIRRTIIYLLSGNLSEITVMLGAAVLGFPAPLAAIHLLWINLVTDGLPALALAAEPVPDDVLNARSKPSPRTFFSRQFYGEVSVIGFITGVSALGVYAYSLPREGELMAKTHVFSFLVFSELFRSFASRSDIKTYFQLGPHTNLFHVAAVLVPITFQFALHHTEVFRQIFKVEMISWTECFWLIAMTLVPVTLIEIRKLIHQRKKRDTV